MAEVFPVFKIKDSLEKEHYRPVSIFHIRQKFSKD